MRLRRSPISCTLVAALATVTIAAPVRANIPEPDHLDCAANYSALSLALPYLPGIFLMFSIAPRSGQAQRIYRLTTPLDEQLPRRAVIAEVERRKQAIMALFEAGAVTLEELIATAYACDAYYGLDRVPITLREMMEPE